MFLFFFFFFQYFVFSNIFSQYFVGVFLSLSTFLDGKIWSFHVISNSSMGFGFLLLVVIGSCGSA